MTKYQEQTLKTPLTTPMDPLSPMAIAYLQEVDERQRREAMVAMARALKEAILRLVARVVARPKKAANTKIEANFYHDKPMEILADITRRRKLSETAQTANHNRPKSVA